MSFQNTKAQQVILTKVERAILSQRVAMKRCEHQKFLYNLSRNFCLLSDQLLCRVRAAKSDYKNEKLKSFTPTALEVGKNKETRST